jgi:hypothetical protein
MFVKGGTMSTIVGEVSTVVTAAFGWAGEAVEFIVANPLVMLFVALPIVGLGIGFLMRLVRG